ncbi:MAG: ribonuclease III [Gammaproteobacteria bacterium]|nr:ribonuclease III [Gammaproteobacteria bacterium]
MKTARKPGVIVLNYHFDDPALLELALTHRSAASRNNERLEYLGDAMLGFVVAEYLYLNFPDANEGQLTRARAALVNKRTLAEVGARLNFGDQIKLGEGEMRSGGWRRESIVANTVEALLGAIYLDAGFDRCREIILEWFAAELADIRPEQTVKDPKTTLQEFLQARGLTLPEYQTLEISGPPHKQTFTVGCRVELLNDTISASGNSRRAAEQQAAEDVLARLKSLETDA